MCAIRALSNPSLPVADPNASSSPGVSAVAVLPCPLAPAQHLAVNIMRTDPKWSTMTHHHGALDTALYVMQGTMAFRCGPGMRTSVAVQAGELASIDPYAVHAEYNPDASVANIGITARDTPGMFIVPCEAPDPMEPHATGIAVVPRSTRAGKSAPTDSGDDGLAPLGSQHLRVPRLALDRLTIAPGEAFEPATGAAGETAICVLGGEAGIVDVGKALKILATEGMWWFVETGTRWRLEGTGGDHAAEVLVIRGLPGL
jgi:uncharacterized RmlC-like cupin family protein